jgi:membrane protein DedA with SNARE-associated domain
MSPRGLLILALALKLHHQFHGPPIGYVGLAAAAAASWIGVPGPGEPVLIAAGIFAAKGDLDITSVLLVAWGGAAVGGVGGWLIGMKTGRRLVTARGPLRKLRLSAVARGDEVFDRVPVLAVLLTPSWIAGIHHVRAAVYLPTNTLAAAAWAVIIGLGAYYVGPSIVDVVDDLGIALGIALVILVIGGIAGDLIRRRRRRARANLESPAPDSESPAPGSDSPAADSETPA